jgi:hypothetical protein
MVEPFSLGSSVDKLYLAQALQQSSRVFQFDAEPVVACLAISLQFNT